MIEATMLIVAGVLGASLLWLLALPVLSRRAIRLAGTRLARGLPVSMAEVGAERDQLRAAHAVERRQLEQTADATAARCAALMGDNGRLLTRQVQLERQVEAMAADIERLGAELAAMTRARTEVEGALGTQTLLLHEALGLAEKRGETLATLEPQFQREQTRTAEQRIAIAALETAASERADRLQAALADVASARADLQATRAAETEREAERDAVRSEGRVLAVERDTLTANVGALTAELARLRGEAEEAARAAEQAQKRLLTQADTIAGLADRIVARDNELTALNRLLAEALAPFEEGQEGSETADGGAPLPRVDRERQLRAAVATLGADLVAFATAERP